MRFILVLTGAVAVSLFAGMNSDWVAGVGLFAGFVLIGLAQWVLPWRYEAILRIACYGLAGVVIWFAAVDRLISHEYCTTCNIHYVTFQYRLLGIPVFASRGNEHSDLLARIASDLGKPCNHRYLRWPLVRRWGLIYGARPFGSIICRPETDFDYDEEYRDRLVQLGKDDPELAETFSRWLQADGERDYALLKAIHARINDTETP